MAAEIGGAHETDRQFEAHAGGHGNALQQAALRVLREAPRRQQADAEAARDQRHFQKKALYGRIAELVAAHGIRPENVFISLLEVPKENWSFGNGKAQYADAPPHLAAAAQ